MPTPIRSLRNLGPSSATWLEGVGIGTVEELRELGPVVAFQLVQARHGAASRNLLWALVAGLEDRDWRELTAADKDRIDRELADDRG